MIFAISPSTLGAFLAVSLSLLKPADIFSEDSLALFRPTFNFSKFSAIGSMLLLKSSIPVFNACNDAPNSFKSPPSLPWDNFRDNSLLPSLSLVIPALSSLAPWSKAIEPSLKAPIFELISEIPPVYWLIPAFNFAPPLFKLVIADCIGPIFSGKLAKAVLIWSKPDFNLSDPFANFSAPPDNSPSPLFKLALPSFSLAEASTNLPALLVNSLIPLSKSSKDSKVFSSWKISLVITT